MVHILVPLETISLKIQPRTPIHGTLESYVRKLIKHGLTPFFISPLTKIEDMDRLYELADGVLFMGGSDVDPAHYGKEKHEKTNINDPLRDTVELALLRRVLADNKPFLGICRGCQILAIASGGTLHQHVPDVVHHENHSLQSESYDAFDNQVKQPIMVDKTSRVYTLLKKDRVLANSGHHQAVATVGADFRIVGKSEDGISEIIEHTDPNYFCFAVQPHPEAEEQGDLEPLFSAFAQAAKTYKEKGK